MNFKQIRQLFVETTGRYELVVDTTNWADNGANTFINAGLRTLDRKAHTRRSKAKHIQTLAIGSFYGILQNSMTIQHVSVTGNDSRTYLKVYTLEEFRDLYASPMSGITSGRPAYYTTALLRTEPETASEILIDNFQGVETVAVGDSWDYNGILFYPPADYAYTLEIDGIFRTPKLVLETDTNFWTVEEPLLLVKAAAYHLETIMRNTEGSRDWLASVEEDLRLLEFELVAEESAGIRYMKG